MSCSGCQNCVGGSCGRGGASAVACYNPYSPCAPACAGDLAPIIFRAVALATSNSTATTEGQISQIAFPFFALPSQYYDVESSSFVAPYSGSYSFQATVTWSSSASNTMLTLFLQKKGLNTKFSASTMAPVPGAYVTTIQGVLPLNAGDFVTVAYQSSAAVALLGSNPYPSPITFFQGQRVC